MPESSPMPASNTQYLSGMLAEPEPALVYFPLRIVNDLPFSVDLTVEWDSWEIPDDLAQEKGP